MTRIEGVTPPKKHKTVEQRRGKFQFHHHIRSKSEQERKQTMVVAVVATFAVLAIWIFLFSKGYLTPKNVSGDGQFISNIQQSLQNAKPLNVPSVQNASNTNVNASEGFQDLFPNLP